MSQSHAFESFPVVVPIAPERGLLKKDVPIDITMVRPVDAEATPAYIVAFLGLGNEKAASDRAAKQLAAHGIGNIAVVSAFPYWKMSPDAAALKRLAAEGSHAVMREMHEMHGSTPVPIHAVAESQQGPSLLWGMLEAPELYTGRTALLRTLALQGEMGGLSFLGRSLYTGFQADQVRNPGFLRVAGRGFWRVACDAAVDRGAGLKFALGADIRDDLRQVVDLVGPDRFVVASAEKDVLFPGEKQHAALKSVGLESIHRVVTGSHTPPAVAPGAEQFVPLAHWMRTGVFLDTLRPYAEPQAA
jgi:hypothetical protein